MTSFTGYWLTRGRPHCLARWLSSSFSPLAGRAVSPILLVAGREHLMRQQPYSSTLPTPTRPPRTGFDQICAKLSALLAHSNDSLWES